MKWSAPGLPGPLICGHRGAPAVAPENTLAGFAVAADRGATWIEFDVRPTADGILAIHHDPVTTSGVRIAETAFDRLGDAIPSFEAVTAAVPDLGLDIEMKTDDVDLPLRAFAELVVAEVDAHCGGRQDVIVTSFDAEALLLVRDLRPDLATGLLFHEKADASIDRAVDDGHVAVAPWIELLDAALVDRARSAGLGIATWTVNTPDQIDRAVVLGADLIIGDDPSLIVERL